MKYRLDQLVQLRGLARSRSQAESIIKLGKVEVDGKVITKPGYFASDTVDIRLLIDEQYVSRAALKLASIAELFQLNFAHATVLDVGSSTGGFTDYALQHGATKVIAVDVGTEQLHPSLRTDPRIELHEQTDIRDVKQLRYAIDIVVIDVSFISLESILPAVMRLCNAQTHIVAMAKPQFEAHQQDVKHKGVIKNDAVRRAILKSFEGWAQQYFYIHHKADSQVAGSKGNIERFYLLSLLNKQT